MKVEVVCVVRSTGRARDDPVRHALAVAVVRGIPVAPFGGTLW